MLAVLTKTAVYINEIQKTYRPGVDENRAVLYYEIAQRQIQFDESTELFTALSWHHDDSLFIGTNGGTCLQLQSENNKINHKIETDSGINKFILTQLHLIILTDRK